MGEEQHSHSEEKKSGCPLETERGKHVNRKLASHPKESGLYRRGRTFLPGFREEKGDLLLQEQREVTSGKGSQKVHLLLEDQERVAPCWKSREGDLHLEQQRSVTSSWKFKAG